MHKKKKALSLLVPFLLAGCLDSDSGSSGNKTPVVAGSGAMVDGDNSYRNFKQVGLTPQDLPAFGDARAYGSFSGGDDLDLFIAELNYSPQTSTAETADPSTFAFYKKEGDGYVPDDTLLDSDQGCIHPRKAIVADFNLNGRPDVFVACHGYDASPFPGEENKIVLSQDDGTYTIMDASTDVGFFHSAAAADLDGDGDPDVVLANNSDRRSVLVLLNQGDGTFERESGTRLPTELGGKNYFTIELADVDGDDILDLLVGGHEWEGADTKVFLNPGNNIFDDASSITIPPVDGEGVVLDFTATEVDGQRYLWVLRTSGGDGTFYESRVVQRVAISGLTAESPEVVANEQTTDWVRWLIPATIDGDDVVASDDAANDFVIQQ